MNTPRPQRLRVASSSMSSMGSAQGSHSTGVATPSTRDELPYSVEFSKLSPRLEAIIKDELIWMKSRVNDIFEVLQQRLAEYRNISDRATCDAIRASVVHQMTTWYECLLKCEPPGPEYFAFVAEHAAKRYQQNISLVSVMNGLRLTVGLLWDRLTQALTNEDVELYREVMTKASPAMLMHFDYVAQALTRSYLEEKQRATRWRHRVQQQLRDCVFDDDIDRTRFLQLTETLGIDASQPQVALAIRLPESVVKSDELDDELVHLNSSIAGILGYQRDTLLSLFQMGHWVTWIPQASLPEALRNLHEASAALPDIASPVLVLGSHCIASIGVGLPGNSGEGWRQSLEQAFKAISYARRLGARRLISRYDDYLLEDAFSSRDEFRQYLDQIAEKLERDPELLETLHVFFELRLHRKAVAGRLGIHPNTLDYRLNRIVSLAGGDLSDIGMLSKLYIMTRLHKLKSTPPSV
eukprot:TRINITY_DN18834_c0_g1_i2.p1 TRINITY_DN18834_c0_g1~~TRINITY_DN18834_c0_g1_i2.p1  ORF type:complete len:467 (+),score=84.66 TRINITY_DN18834_c0_g1_i2:1330-2730(+)